MVCVVLCRPAGEIHAGFGDRICQGGNIAHGIKSVYRQISHDKGGWCSKQLLAVLPSSDDQEGNGSAPIRG
jgi:hypothetical protein